MYSKRSEAEVMTDAGYCIEQLVFSDTECGELAQALSMAKGTRAGIRHLMSNPAGASAASDPRLLAIARRELGRDPVAFRATLFEKSDEKNWLIAWHQDTALPLESRFDAEGWGSWSEKAGIAYAHAPAWALSRVVALRLHLDASTAENGPLRVISGSHTFGVLNDNAVADYARTHPETLCAVPRGGVLAMRPLLIHASSKAISRAPRRVLHIEYSDSLELAPGIRLAIA
jgi:ectoine hydroxylase-related dioxygenase (phytanoyl-CoA dioxygenase family)